MHLGIIYYWSELLQKDWTIGMERDLRIRKRISSFNILRNKKGSEKWIITRYDLLVLNHRKTVQDLGIENKRFPFREWGVRKLKTKFQIEKSKESDWEGIPENKVGLDDLSGQEFKGTGCGSTWEDETKRDELLFKPVASL